MIPHDCKKPFLCSCEVEELAEKTSDKMMKIVKGHFEQRLKAGQHETIVIGEGELEHPIAFLEAELDSLIVKEHFEQRLKDAYRESTNADYSRMVLSVKKAIKILKKRQ